MRRNIRHGERKRVFNVEEFCRLAAESVGRGLSDVISISKLGEGGFNRAFLITMSDQFQMVARIPYSFVAPKYLAIASEVATMDFLREVGVPTPRIYSYSPSAENAAGTEYIFMELIKGDKLSDIWGELDEDDLIGVVQDLARIEGKMTLIAFPAGGSLYYTKDLENTGQGPGVPLKNPRFCVGPDTRLCLWYGKREALDVPRGPCMLPSSFLFLLSDLLLIQIRLWNRRSRRQRSRRLPF